MPKLENTKVMKHNLCIECHIVQVVNKVVHKSYVYKLENTKVMKQILGTKVIKHKGTY